MVSRSPWVAWSSAYKVKNDSPPLNAAGTSANPKGTFIEHMNISPWSGIGQPSGGYVAKYYDGGILPSGLFMSSFTSQFNADWATPQTSPPILSPGDSSITMLIFTNATGYTGGFATVQDNPLATSNQPSLVPAPEPGAIALALISLPLLGLYGLRRRTRV
jgi:hypothetical protein